MSMHDGHRQRLRNRFLTEGLDNFNDINVLEMLLFYTVPRKDTNEIAHRLLDAFGSFSGVFDAKVEDLEKVEGVGSSSATFLSLLGSFSRYYQKSLTESINIVKTIDECASILRPLFSGRRDERVYLLCLDAKCKVICTKFLSEGSVNTTAISMRKIVETALSVNASSVVLAHNHPSGLALPSENDVYTTSNIAKTLKSVDITLVDHLIFGDEEYISMNQSGYFDVAP